MNLEIAIEFNCDNISVQHAAEAMYKSRRMAPCPGLLARPDRLYASNLRIKWAKLLELRMHRIGFMIEILCFTYLPPSCMRISRIYECEGSMHE